MNLPPPLAPAPIPRRVEVVVDCRTDTISYVVELDPAGNGLLVPPGGHVPANLLAWVRTRRRTTPHRPRPGRRPA